MKCFPRSEKKSFYLNLLPYVTAKAEELSLAEDSARKDSVLRVNANNLGIWEIQYITDIFGEPTSEKYITTLAKGESVQLIGFGTFKVGKRNARTGRNPQTGKAIKIAAKKVAQFKAGKALSEK